MFSPLLYKEGFGKFPTYLEITVEKGNDVDFPNKKVFSRWGTKDKFIAKVLEYCKGKTDYNDIVALCESILENINEEKFSDDSDTGKLGEVYLFKSGRYYKIGKTNDTVRRGSEIRSQLPEKCDLIYSIKTDDPSGIEALEADKLE